ncbi:MAG: GntG family PLP-dependent aldolase, partial [Flavobacteriales bacterium]|nr:GntG family PLP-dependent aldolase [Flavobacteriales bacterium]
MNIDLRSDTVTKPTPEMLKRMLSAPVGDDVFGEDPTVNELQERLADMFGQEAGLFCPSGTMTNQIGINVHVQPGDEVICDQLSHVYNYEGGGIARNSGASIRLTQGDSGRFTAAQAEAAINPDDSHYARTKLISVEDTCNKGGGCFYDKQHLEEISALAKQRGLGFHLDGARVFNALEESAIDTNEYGSLFDSISICLSKGLGTPGGSVLLGSKPFIQEAHRVRKSMGGGMRQIGILAAAGLHALDHH